MMLLHAAAPKHPHSSCWSVCAPSERRSDAPVPHEEEESVSVVSISLCVRGSGPHSSQTRTCAHPEVLKT